jgi:hypothetical protein
VLVVADQCTHRTAAVAHHNGALTTLTEAHNVGVARSVGAARTAQILEREGYRDEETWLAYTDADTLVPPDWLARHLAHAADGWSAVLDAVRVRGWSPRAPGTKQPSNSASRACPRSSASTARTSAYAPTSAAAPADSRRWPAARTTLSQPRCADSVSASNQAGT